MFTVEQAQAMVDRAYGQALNDAAAGVSQPWQDGIPSVEVLRRDLIMANTWPCTPEERAEILQEAGW